MTASTSQTEPLWDPATDPCPGWCQNGHDAEPADPREPVAHCTEDHETPIANTGVTAEPGAFYGLVSSVVAYDREPAEIQLMFVNNRTGLPWQLSPADACKLITAIAGEVGLATREADRRKVSSRLVLDVVNAFVNP
jgi:hypothetical protein